MADEVQFDLVSPERSLASQKVTAVQIPGADGDMTAMASHAPTITTLRPGVLRTEGGGEPVEYVVTGGFAQISPEGITVLAERAIPRAEMTQQELDDMVAEAAAAHNAAKDGDHDHNVVDDAAKLLADMVAMGDEIGLSPNQPNL